MVATSLRSPTRRVPTEARYPLLLLAIFAATWIALAIAPWHRREWLIENLLVLLGLPLLVWSWRWLRFSNGAYTALFVFLVLGAIGAHYTYAMVPYDEWWSMLTGSTLSDQLGLERNHYDRVVHFAFGLLLTPLVDEWIAARSPLRGAWRYLLPVCVLATASMVFELLEWVAVELWGGGQGMAYLGIQGDEWDAHKDMALATLGAVLTVAWLGWRRRRR